jgi:hypothetical protein
VIVADEHDAQAGRSPVAFAKHRYPADDLFTYLKSHRFAVQNARHGLLLTELIENAKTRGPMCIRGAARLVIALF